LAGIDGTSKMSSYLKFGEIHPRTLLANLGASKAHDTFRKEIAWREFYADVLFHNPHTDTDYYAPRFKEMRYDKPGAQFKAFCEGKTGYPFVDAAIRQLLSEGWMHNRTRMVVASFLVKDLHLEWQLGERFFADHLIDYDPASNAHGWQWTAQVLTLLRITESSIQSNKARNSIAMELTSVSMFLSLRISLIARFTSHGFI
jgi:deoxyribodipyrimidine photo-lyase